MVTNQLIQVRLGLIKIRSVEIINRDAIFFEMSAFTAKFKINKDYLIMR